MGLGTGDGFVYFFRYLTALVYGLLFILSDTFNKLHVHKSIKSGPVKVG